VTLPETQPAPLRRDRSRAVLGGVCAGLAPRLGLDPLFLRIGFLVAAVAGGVGVAFYAVAWALLPAGEGSPGERPLIARAAGRRQSWQVAAGLVLLVLAVLLLFMASLPIKMVLRWTINLKYLVAIPEFFFNI
jgi:phage shock protein PspC (stress-responsive transcriptional regulator)